MKIVQANLKPSTVKRIAKIADEPVVRGLDKMINECFDKLEKGSCNHNSNGESESE